MTYFGPNLGLETGFELDQDGWGPPYNEAMRRLDALTDRVALDVVDTLPGSPTDGDRYLLSASATENPNKFAVRVQGAWSYYAPPLIQTIFVKSLGYWVRWHGGAWVDQGVPSHSHSIGAITGLTAALAGKQDSLGFTAENVANKGNAGGYASLDGSGKVPSSQLPSSVGSGSPLVPATSGAPSDTPSVSGGHPIRYDPATDRLFVFDGVDWFFTALTKVIQGVGAIEGLVGWWVVDDLTTFGAGDSVSSLAGRVGPTWDNTGYSSPTMLTNEINGKRALNFASGQSLQLPSNVFASATAGELFFVLKGAGESMGNNFPRWGNSGQAQHYPYSGGQVYIDALRNTRVDFSPSPVTLTNWHVIRVQSNSNFRISLNGTQVFNAASGAFSPRTTPLLSGADLNNSARIAAVIAFNTSAKSGGVLTSEEYSVVRDWINSTFAILLT